MSKSFRFEPTSPSGLQSAVRAVIAPLLAGSMLAGAFVALPAIAGDRSVDKASEALQENDADRAVRHAEKAVVEAPRDASRRALLGQAYLRAGRLTSARSALGEAVSLGEASPRVALMLALAEIGSGSPRVAVGILAQQGSAIPAADRGLAFALAGETARGVEVISADIRAGNDTPKSRQNLAYAYALDGRWREARLMASQDVSLDVLDQRMTEWAMTARPEYAAARVAALVGATVQADRGMPTELALANFPAAKPVARPAPMMAAAPESVVAKPLMVKPVVAKAPAPVVVARAEPAKSEVKIAAVPASKAAEPRATMQQAFQPAVNKPVASKAVAAKPISAKAVATKVALAPASKASARQSASALPAPSAAGSHVAQLGSYSSEAAARAGWKVFQSRYTNLKGHQPVIMQAKVDGKDYWRVAAGGFDAKGANQMCQAVKASGQGCLPIAKAGAKAGGGAVRVAKAD